MAEKNVKKAEETQKAETTGVEAQEPQAEAQEAPKPKTKADILRERVEKRGFVTDRDISELQD